jgi:hypothetical protein
VQRDDGVADLARDEGGETTLPVAAFSPRGRVVTLSHLLGDGCSMVAVLSPHFVDLPVTATRTL